MKLAAWLWNPVMAREARVRMRGWRAPALISLYVGLLGAIVLFFLYVVVSVEQGGFSPTIGGILYGVLAFAQGALLVFSAPGLTAGAISGERERQTLDLLLITRLSPLQVVVGKLGAALGFTLLLMLASLPVYGILFLFGGVSLGRLALTAIVYVATVILLGSIGMYFSAVFKRTQAAVVASYGTTFGWMAFVMVMGIMFMEVFYRGRTPTDVPPDWAVIFAYTNPIVALGAAAGGPIGEITSLFRKVLPSPELQMAIWWKYCLIATGISGWLLWLTSRRIMPLKNK